jgi:hypothetical protein
MKLIKALVLFALVSMVVSMPSWMPKDKDDTIIPKRDRTKG